MRGIVGLMDNPPKLGCRIAKNLGDRERIQEMEIK
jgi:hypothetical protein